MDGEWCFMFRSPLTWDSNLNRKLCGKTGCMGENKMSNPWLVGSMWWVCVCVCVRARVCVCVCVRERVSERQRVCMYVRMLVGRSVLGRWVGG
jgi:hypothetical protein